MNNTKYIRKRIKELEEKLSYMPFCEEIHLINEELDFLEDIIWKLNFLDLLKANVIEIENGILRINLKDVYISYKVKEWLNNDSRTIFTKKN